MFDDLNIVAGKRTVRQDSVQSKLDEIVSGEERKPVPLKPANKQTLLVPGKVCTSVFRISARNAIFF